MGTREICQVYQRIQHYEYVATQLVTCNLSEHAKFVHIHQEPCDCDDRLVFYPSMLQKVFVFSLFYTLRIDILSTLHTRYGKKLLIWYCNFSDFPGCEGFIFDRFHTVRTTTCDWITVRVWFAFEVSEPRSLTFSEPLL